MSDTLDIGLILPFLNHRLNGPMYVSFIAIVKLSCAALFVVYSLRILYMMRKMALAEHKELRDRKLNELMESIANLEKELEEKKERKKRKKMDKEVETVSAGDDKIETEGHSSNVNAEERTTSSVGSS